MVDLWQIYDNISSFVSMDFPAHHWAGYNGPWIEKLSCDVGWKGGMYSGTGWMWWSWMIDGRDMFFILFFAIMYINVFNFGRMILYKTLFLITGIPAPHQHNVSEPSAGNLASWVSVPWPDCSGIIGSRTLLQSGFNAQKAPGCEMSLARFWSRVEVHFPFSFVSCFGRSLKCQIIMHSWVNIQDLLGSIGFCIKPSGRHRAAIISWILMKHGIVFSPKYWKRVFKHV